MATLKPTQSPSFTTKSSTVVPASAPTTKPSESSNALRDITSGIIGGILSKFVEYPFDTVKVRLQSQSDLLPLRYKGPLDCIRQGYRSDGLKGFYRGVSAPLVGAAAENASLFWSYEVAKDVIRGSGFVAVEGLNDDYLPLGAKVVAGMASGAVTSLILTPIELVKCRMQAPMQSTVDPTLRSHPSLSPLRIVSAIYRDSGVSGFWRGHLGTFLRETGGTAAWFGGNEAMLTYFRRQNSCTTANPSPMLWQQLLSGALAGVSYNFFLYPADTIKSKIQTNVSLASRAQPGFWSVGREIWRNHGLQGLYRGCGLTCLRSAPSSALIFTVVEKLKEAWPR